MKEGTLKVHTENIFPIIKKFLYSDHEIFLRELVANAVDATQKLKTLSTASEFTDELGDTTIKISIDKKKKTLTIADAGIGMTEEEVEQYINQIAFSSAEEFVAKYADKGDTNAIIGHFGLGFYSAFMVADKVELNTKSWKKDAAPVKWECTGTTNFSMDKSKKKTRGTEIILHLNEDALEFLEEVRIETLLKKYCSFMPVEIEFNGAKINNTSPLWLKKPADITEEEYKKFYEELYPFSPEPLFWIHLNVDYPFNLTGILYFPMQTNMMEVSKKKIQLYSNQVFITDEVKEIVPEFLTLLHGVIDSPDIPLNVSRSYLQADASVKKISTYIVKKVADKLADMFKDNRDEYEKKWRDIGFFIKYGMLTDEKFYDRAKDFFLFNNIENEFYTIEAYKEKIKVLQEDKDKNLVALYTIHKEQQDAFINLAKNRSYDVLLMDNPIDLHTMQLLEDKGEKIHFKRVDSDTMDKLIDKDTKSESVLSEDEVKQLEELYKAATTGDKFTVKAQALSPEDAPVTITQSEWMRRFAEMNRMQGMADNDMLNKYEVIINSNNPLNKELLSNPDKEKQALATRHLFDLARLGQHLLSGAELTEFVGRSLGYMKGA